MRNQGLLHHFQLAPIDLIKTSQWNWLIPGKTTRDKMYRIYTPLLQSFLQLSSGPDGDMLTLCEDSTVNIIPVALAKDGMQLKPGLLYDTRQGKLIGNTLNLDYNYIKQGEPDNSGYDKE